MAAPATTTAPAPTVAPSPTTSGGGSSRAAREPRPSATGFPSTAPSWIFTPAPIVVPAWITTFAPMSTSCGRITSSASASPGARSDARSTRALLERPLELLQHAHHAQAALRAGTRRSAVADALDEVRALEPQRLVVADRGAPDVAGSRDVLAVGGRVLVEALVVHRHLALGRHVVERGHPLRTDHREAPLLVRVEPREVQVGREAGREAQVGEHHILDAAAHVALADRAQLLGLLVAGQSQHDRHVVRAQRPQRVLVGAQ